MALKFPSRQRVRELALRALTFVPGWLTLAAASVATSIHLFFMLPYSQQLGFDEGFEAAAAERLVDGQWLPYVDAVAHRGPFLYWFLALFQVLTGRFEFTGSRALGLTSCVVTVVATLAFGWAARWPLAGAIGAVAYVYATAVSYDVNAGVAVTAEPVGIAVLMVACFAAAFGSHRAKTGRGRIGWLVAAGALLGVATFTKQTLSLAVFPLGWFIAAIEAGRDDEQVARWKRVATRALLPFVAGGLGLVGLILLRYAVVGELGSFIFWSTGFNAKIYMEPYQGKIISSLVALFFEWTWAQVALALALVVAIGRPLSRIREFSARGLAKAAGSTAFETMVGFGAVMLTLGAAIPLRIWPHYFIPIWPFFGLVAGVGVEGVLRRGEVARVGGQLVVAVILGSLLVGFGVRKLLLLHEQRDVQGWYKNPRPNPVCAEIDRLAGPGHEAFFVWGTYGDLYISCRRPSSSFFTYTTTVAGIVPPFWNEPTLARTAPGSREKLLAELTAKPPPVILDAPVGSTTMVSMAIYEPFLRARYCRVPSVADIFGRSFVFYARKDLAACATAAPW